MSRRALVFGEALFDCFPDRRVVAGAPLNVSVHLARAGWHTSLVTRLGEDEDGRAIQALLEERGVETGLVEHDPERPTGTVTIRLHDDGGHDFTIHRPAAWDAIAGPETWPGHDVLVYGSLAGREAISRATLLRLLREPCPLRAFDVNLRPPDVRDDVLEAGLAAARLLKLNGDELPEVARRLGIAPSAEALLERTPGLRWVCVTLGDQGAELVDRETGRCSIDGARVEVVDTVGAGDAFTAGLVDALSDGVPGQQALERARGVASVVLSRRGGLPPAD